MIYSIDNNIKTIPEEFTNTRLIALCSGSKGIGKTWLAATICHCLALHRKKILFFDADCGLENVSFQLDLNNLSSYIEILNGGITLNNAVQNFNRGGFDIISAPAGENGLVSAPLGRVQILAEDLYHFANYYDSVILDCPDENLQSANVFLSLCRLIIMVVNPDPFSLTQAYQKIVRLNKINPTAQIKIVINHAQSYEEGKQIFKSLLKAAKEYIKVDIALLGIIRQDSHIREAVLNKALLLKRYPACRGSEDAVIIGKKILEEQFNDN